VNRPRDQFLARARFSRDQHGRVRRRHLRNGGVDCVQGRRRTDNFLEHGGLVEFLPEDPVLCLGAFLAGLQHVDVRPGGKPAHHRSGIIVKRREAQKDPAVLAIVPPESSCQFGTDPRGKTPKRHAHTVQIGPVDDYRPAIRINDLLSRQTRVSERCHIRVSDAAVQTEHQHEMRDEIHQHSRLSLVLTRPFLAALQRVDVGARAVPANSLTVRIAQRIDPDQKPPVGAVCSEQPPLEFNGKPAEETISTIFDEATQVVRVMNQTIPLKHIGREQRAGESLAVVVEDRSVGVLDGEVRAEDEDLLRHDLEQRSKLLVVRDWHRR
jgi:hypothetical protein